MTPARLVRRILGLSGLVAVVVWLLHDQLWNGMRLAGLSLPIPCFILWVVARIQLGESFSIRPRAKNLVTHGLYSKIRNPIYLFGLLFICGLFLALGKPWWLMVFVVLVPMQVLRARKEEKVLRAKFGDAYMEYRRQTWF